MKVNLSKNDLKCFYHIPKKLLTRDYFKLKQIKTIKKVNESLESKFKKGMLLELVDKKRLCNMRIGRVIDNVGGRIRMKYENNDDFDDFWCHESSELIHPIGWSAAVGHQINASEGSNQKI